MCKRLLKGEAMPSSTKVAIVGITGYTGMELIRLLHNHPEFELSVLTSRQEAGRKLEDIFPQLKNYPEGAHEIIEPEIDCIAKNCSLTFLATPPGISMELVPDLLARGLRVIDLSADFRLSSQEQYQQWYGITHSCPEIIPRAVYGIPELYPKQIEKAQLIANPGCYPISVILALAPVLKKGMLYNQDIVIDSKSGVTGAGRTAKLGFLFSELNNSFTAYSIGKHRHTPEIEQELAAMSKERQITVSFNPHLLPINRGIISTIYTWPTSDCSSQDIYKIFSDFYANNPWIRILPPGQMPQAKDVRGSMFCDIGFVLDTRTKRLIIVSAIDNLCRGASGQALANANILFGLNSREGLNISPLTP